MLYTVGMATNRQRLRKQVRRKHFNSTRPRVAQASPRPMYSESMSLLMLRTEASEKRIVGRSKMTKVQLVEALNNLSYL